MNAALVKPTLMTATEYFAWEADQVERHDFVHAAHRNGFLWHAEDHSGVFILRNGVSATFVQQLHATGPVVTHTAQDDGEWVSASTIGGRSEQHIYRRLVPIDLFYGEGAGKLSEIDNKFFKLNIAAH